MGRLFIAEKPELARAIVDGLGGGEKHDSYYLCSDNYVTWCIGHMLELYEPEDYDSELKQWNLEQLPIRNRPIKYKPKASTRTQLNAVLDLIKNDSISTIVHAGDPDAEGQLIIDELLLYANNNKPVLRFMTNDNNTSIVQKALNNLIDNAKYYHLFQSALARNVGDQLYGFNMTRAYTVAAQKKGYNGMLPVGRVQTPILGLVVNRDRAHASHEKQKYYDVVGSFIFNNIEFDAKYLSDVNSVNDGRIDDKNRIIDIKYAETVVDECSDKSACISDCKSEIKREPPPLPYNMLNLQADAARLFDYKPDQVMKFTQELRETYRLITYNGSDCQYLNEEQHSDAPQVLKAIADTSIVCADLVKNANSGIKSRAFNNKYVSAHHAIIPTTATADLNALPDALRNIYILIAKRYIAQFFPDYEYRNTVVAINVNAHKFRTVSNIALKDGWKIVFGKSLESDDSEEPDNSCAELSALKNGDNGKCTKCIFEEKTTKPLPLYTMATLLKDLTRVSKYITDERIKKLLIEKDKDKKSEHGGIGTSRTRDIIIKKLFDNGFLKEKGKNIISTKLANDFYDALPRVATAPDMTALWHEQQVMIENNTLSCDEFLDELMVYITEQVDIIKNNGLGISVETFDCPVCEEGILIKRKSKNGSFWGCNKFPACKTTLPNKKGKPDYDSLNTVPCPTCEQPLKRVKGQYGYFWPCSTCKVNFKDHDGKPLHKSEKRPGETDHECPECATHNLIRRVSAKKVPWYGCAGFPNCKFTCFEKNGLPEFKNMESQSV